MKIAVYGAAGYTGRLVAAEVARRGIEPVLAGRNAERLGDAAAGLGFDDADVRVADIDDPRALSAAFAGCDGVVNCAGPFTALGEPVVRAAIAAGVHYVDTTAEQLYIQRIFDGCGADAEHAGVTVIPSMGYDLAPGDLIAHLAGELVEPLESLTLSYDIRDFGMTRGSMRSVLQMFSGVDVTYRDGGWRPAGSKARRPPVTFPGESRPSLTMKYAGGAVITVPRHLKVRDVELVMRADALVPRPVAGAVTSLMPVTGAIMRTPLRGAIDALIDRLPEGPPPEKRARAAFSFVADAVGTDGRRTRGVVSGTDVYAGTAVTAVEGLHRLIIDGAPPGVLAPSQAFDPADFLDTVGLTWSVEGPFTDGGVR